MLTLANVVEAAPSNQTISFSARLKNSSGGVVADGYYNIGFRLYSQSTGGSAIWTEIYHDANGPAAGQDNRIKVSNGYFSVKLGSLEQFTGVDWSGDLFLTMDIGGTAQEATIANIDWDGEMTPRIQLSAMPYAMNAQMLGGKTADDFFQIGNGVQDSGSNASIAINKTGTGDLVNLQSSGTDVFTLSGSGSITMGSLSSQSISVADSATGAGQSLTLAAGSATSGDNDGGDLVLQAGSGSGTGSDGVITMASSVSVGAGNTITMVGGATSLRPASPSEGTIYYDTDTKELLVYADSQWQALNGGSSDGKTATAIVAASNSPQAIKDSADFVADGTDDQVEINAALTAAAGGSVYLAEGLYTVSASISVPNNTTLSGAGKGTKLELANLGGASINMIQNSDTSTGTGVTIENMSLDGRIDVNTTGTQHAISFSGMGSATRQGGVIRGINFINPRGSGVQLVNSGNNQINNNKFSSSISAPPQIGIVLSNSTNNQITGNSIAGGFSRAIQLYSGTEKTTVANNLIDGASIGIRAGLSSGSAANQTTITGNLISNTERGVEIYAGSYTTVSSNNITNSSENAIHIGSGTKSNVSISSNTIHNTGNIAYNNAIYIMSGTNISVTSNTITDTQAMTSNYAISIYSSSAVNTYLSSNNLGAGSIYDAGNNTTYANQRDASGKLINRSEGGFGVQTSAGSDAMTIDSTSGDVAIAGTLEAGSIETTAVDTSSAGTLALGANNATSVTIGSSDTEATTLVLDTKTSEGDPTGAVSGAMYYNSDAGKFRCYQSSEWTDCITPLPVAKRVSTQQAIPGTATDVDDLSFELAANTKYHYKFNVTTMHGSVSTGVGFGVTAPTNIVSNNWCVNTTSVTTTNSAGSFGAYCGVADASASTGTTGAETTSVGYPSTMEGYIETGDDAGTLQLRAIRISSGSDPLNIEIGSFGVLQVVE